MTLAELRVLFEQERALFAQAIPRAALAKLTIRPRPPGAAARDYAYAEGDRVTLFEETADLPLRNVLGIIRHELGHVCDPIDDDECDGEARADEIAELVTGVRIRYDRRGVQTIGYGGQRPAWLLC